MSMSASGSTSAFEFSEEQQMAQKMLRAWCEAELAPHVRAMEKGELLPYELGRKLWSTFGAAEMARGSFERLERRVAAGTTGVGIGDGDGDGNGNGDGDGSGGGGGMIGRDAALSAILAMELSRVCPGFMLAIGASVGLAGGAVMRRGTIEQKRRWGLPLVTLEAIGAWGMTEPGGGSDAFGGMRTTARRSGEGRYVLSGQKTFITNAPFADVLVVYAKIVDDGAPDASDPRTRPIHAFVLDKGMPGLSLGKPMDKMGMHSSPTGEIFLDDVEVGTDRLLGGVEQKAARSEARDVFQGERYAMVPMCLGIVERCLEDSLAYAKQRVAWGQPIAEYQLMQEKLARMYVHRENIRNSLFKYLDGMKPGARKAPQRVVDPMARAAASAAKLYATRAATEVAMEAVQILGGNGYMREYHVEMLARDAKLLQIGGGTDEVQIVTIARDLLAR